MTTMQIDTNDKNAIQEIKNFAIQKFHFKVKIMNDTKIVKNSDLNDKLKALKSINFEKKGNLHKAFLSLNKKLENFTNIDIKKEKKEYFDKKYLL